MKLIVKLNVSIVLIALIGFATLGGLSFFKTQSIISEEVGDLTGIIVDGLSDNISNTMAQYRIAANLLTKSDVVKTAYRTGDYDPLLVEFDNFVSEFPNVSNVYIGYNNKDFSIYPSIELPADYDPTKRPWYTNAEEAGEAFWVDPYINATDNTLIVSLAVPVYDNSLDFIGVLSMDINLSNLNDEMNQVQISDTGFPVLVDALGNTMTHRSVNLIGMPVPIIEITNAIANNEKGGVDYKFNGFEKHAIFSTVEETGWRILVVLTDDETIRKVTPMLLQIVTVGLVSLVVMVAVVTLITSKHTTV